MLDPNLFGMYLLVYVYILDGDLLYEVQRILGSNNCPLYDMIRKDHPL